VQLSDINGRSSIQTNIKKTKRDDATFENDVTETLGGKMISKPETKSNNRDERFLGETPKTKVRRKRTTTKEESSVESDLGERLVGSRVKVWWPLDKTFYAGVNFYDPLKKKHQVLYANGDEEIFNFQKKKKRTPELHSTGLSSSHPRRVGADIRLRPPITRVYGR
jgi:hypothetical protein